MPLGIFGSYKGFSSYVPAAVDEDQICFVFAVGFFWLIILLLLFCFCSICLKGVLLQELLNNV